MFKKMMKHLVNNPGLKVLSILISVVLWLAVVKMADPESTKSFSVPVEILNKNVITEMGKVPSVVKDSDVAVFYISGPRSYVEDMSGDDFNVTADLSQVDLSQEGDPKLVPIEISARKNDKRIDIIRRTVNLQITLEGLAEKKFVISPDAVGTPVKGYAIGNVEVTPNLLKVSGPESVVSRISRVVASINVDGVSSDVSDNVAPTLYDEEENVIASDLLDMNQSIVTIRAKILGTKDVPIHFEVSGTPAEGCQYQGMEYAPESVMIKGDPIRLNNISVINIPEDVLNIDGINKDLDTTIDITPYLGEGISLVDETANQIAVKVMIERKESKVFNLPSEKITVTGLNSVYQLEYAANTVPVTVRALKEDMEALHVGDIQAAIHVTDLPPGTHSIPVDVTLPDDSYEVAGSVNVQVTITDTSAAEEEGDQEGQEGSGSENNGDAAGTERPGNGSASEDTGGASNTGNGGTSGDTGGSPSTGNGGASGGSSDNGRSPDSGGGRE